MIDFASASMRCSSPENAEEVATGLAADLKLGKPCYRTRTDQRFMYWFALPRNTEFFAQGLDLGPLGHPLTLRYEEDASLDASTFALRALALFEEDAPPVVSIDMTVEAAGDASVNLHRNAWSEDWSNPVPADRAFGLIDFGTNDAVEIASSLLSESSFESLRAGGHVRLGADGDDFSRGTYADVLARLRQGDRSQIHFRGDWPLVGPSLAAIVKTFVRDRRPQEARLDLATHVPTMDARIAELNEALGSPKWAMISSFYPSRKWSPFSAPAGAEEGKPVRFMLYARDAGSLRIQLDIVHRAPGEPLLDFQVVDESGKRRAAKELAKRLSGHPDWNVWTGDPWERANA